MKENTYKDNNPNVVFPDDIDYKKENKRDELKGIEAERERIREEQANMISIIPPTQQSTQEPSPDKNTMEKNVQQNSNMSTSDHSSQLQIDCTAETKPQFSITSSSTSQDYHTTPVSLGINEILYLNTKELQELNETL